MMDEYVVDYLDDDLFQSANDEAEAEGEIEGDDEDALMAKLAQLVEENPCLWQLTSKQYRDKRLKINCWTKIAKKCNLANSQEAKKKFDNYRNRYNKARAKMSKSGSGLEEGETPAIVVYWGFLANAKTHLRTFSNFPQSQPASSSSSAPFSPTSLPSTCPADFRQSTLQVHIASSSSSHSSSSPSLPPSPVASLSQPSPGSTEKPVKPLRKRPVAVEESMDSMANSFKSWVSAKAQSAAPAPEEERPDIMWAKSVAGRLKICWPKLSKFSQRRYRRQMNELLDEIEDNAELDN